MDQQTPTEPADVAGLPVSSRASDVARGADVVRAFDVAKAAGVARASDVAAGSFMVKEPRKEPPFRSSEQKIRV